METLFPAVRGTGKGGSGRLKRSAGQTPRGDDLPPNWEKRVQTAQGSPQWLSILSLFFAQFAQFHPLQIQDGGAEGVGGIQRDPPHRLRAAVQRQEAREEIQTVSAGEIMRISLSLISKSCLYTLRCAVNVYHIFKDNTFVPARINS